MSQKSTERDPFPVTLLKLHLSHSKADTTGRKNSRMVNAESSDLCKSSPGQVVMAMVDSKLKAPGVGQQRV